MGLQLITAPLVYPITLEEAKAHLRVDYSDDDALINALISAATLHVDGKDGWLGRALVEQTWDLHLDAFPCDAIKIPLPPLISVTGVFYRDDDGIERTMLSEDYEVDNRSEPGWVVPGDDGWPSVLDTINTVRVRFVAGYASGEDSPSDATDYIPMPIKQGILMYVATMYAHRENFVIGQSAVGLPWAAEQLLQPYRIYG